MKTVRVYNSCLNTAAIDAFGLQPMKDLIAKYGGWSVSSNYNSSVTTATRIGKTARDLNVNSLFGVVSQTDMYDSNDVILKVT
jgi:predicted metalloendopeptidase